MRVTAIGRIAVPFTIRSARELKQIRAMMLDPAFARALGR